MYEKQIPRASSKELRHLLNGGELSETAAAAARRELLRRGVALPADDPGQWVEITKGSNDKPSPQLWKIGGIVLLVYSIYSVMRSGSSLWIYLENDISLHFLYLQLIWVFFLIAACIGWRKKRAYGWYIAAISTITAIIGSVLTVVQMGSSFFLGNPMVVLSFGLPLIFGVALLSIALRSEVRRTFELPDHAPYIALGAAMSYTLIQYLLMQLIGFG